MGGIYSYGLEVTNMKTKTKLFMSFIAAMTFVLLGCGLTGTPPLPERIEDDLTELQGLLPILDAGLTLGVPDDDGLTTSSVRIKTFDPNPYPEAPNETPAQYYAAGTPDANGDVRFPAAGDAYITDFYGVTGNKAYLLIQPDALDPTLFVVNLYIYPTLSTTVEYVHEEYLVDGDTLTWAIVDGSGSLDPLAYVTNETVYFDGRVATHDVQWTRYVDELYYQASSISVPEDPNDMAYDFPADPENEEPAKVAAAPADGNYSARIESSLTDPAATVLEFYTEEAGQGIRGVSYVETSDSAGRYSSIENTVRRYSDDLSGLKKIRARTTAAVSVGSFFSSTRIITEVIDITVNASGQTVFDSTIVSVNDDTGGTIYAIETLLTETAADSDDYTGTLTYTAGTDSPVEYTVTLDSTSGLEISNSGRGSRGRFPLDRNSGRSFVADLVHGGNFSGQYQGGRLLGNYNNGRQDVDVQTSLSISVGQTGPSYYIY